MNDTDIITVYKKKYNVYRTCSYGKYIRDLRDNGWDIVSTFGYNSWEDIWKKFSHEVYIPLTGVTPMMIRDWLEKNYEPPKHKEL